MDEFSPHLFFSLKRYAHQALWQDGKPVWSALQELDRYFAQIKEHRIEITIPPGVYLDRPELISIGRGTILEPGVYIQGPCILGKECVVRHGAYLRDMVICGDRCAIGHSAEIKHSILLDQANATHFTYVGDSILGNRVNLGAGVKCANLRLDRSEVSVSTQSGKVKTGLRKMGAILGDGSQIGCNCVLNPGTLIGPETLCPALTSLSGTLAPKTKIKASCTWTAHPSTDLKA
ncbi:MAG TPA: UDP-N-acetylglucosamine diphosphorylase [Parachlamydiales bacterium]|nr:UDP-N-acetylglucosamine diphosphorylase [Parachlamydiales bacterium]